MSKFIGGFLIREEFTGFENVYDFERGLYGFNRGWVRFHTLGSPSNQGRWLNPLTLKAVVYSDGGDVKWYVFKDREVFVSWVERTSDWWFDEGGKLALVSSVCQPDIIQEFKDLGFGDLSH